MSKPQMCKRGRRVIRGKAALRLEGRSDHQRAHAGRYYLSVVRRRIDKMFAALDIAECNHRVMT